MIFRKSPPANKTMPFSLPSDHVLLNREFGSKRDVIQVIGDVMVRSGDVNPAYARAMFEKEDQYSTWITEGVALPHGTNQAKKEVLRNSIVFVQIPKGVDWDEGKTVHLAIGLAGTGDEQHLKLLAALAGVLQRPENIERLRSSASSEEVIGMLTAGDGQEVE
jgi:PTS system mannitol-specific IIA component